MRSLKRVQEDPCIALNNDAQLVMKTLVLKFDAISKNENAQALVLYVKDKVLNKNRLVTKPAVSEIIRKFQMAVHGHDVYRHYFLLLQDLQIKIKEETADIIFWLLIESLLHSLLKKDAPEFVDLSPETLNTEISEIELQTLRYAAGYIVKKLKKHSRDELHPVIEKLVEFSESDTAERNSFWDYTRSMLELHDRGGLVHINDKFYVLILGFEKIVKPFLCVDHPELSNKITSALTSNVQLRTIWDQIVSDELGEEVKTMLYSRVIEYYVTLRLKSYARAHDFLLDKRETAKKRKSLRHELN